MKTLWILFFLLGFGSMTTHAQIFTDSRRTFSYTDDSTIMPGDVKVIEIMFGGNCRYYPEFVDSLQALVDFLLANPNIAVLISVHTDSRGSADMNRKLSACRAENYGYFFKSKKVPSFQYKLEGKGEDEPLITDETIDAEPDEITREHYHRLNRRTEVKIISTTQ